MNTNYLFQQTNYESTNLSCIHPLEPLTFIPAGRAYLMLLPALNKEPITGDGSAAKALELLASPRFAQRPAALSDEVQQRISELRNDWGDR